MIYDRTKIGHPLSEQEQGEGSGDVGKQRNQERGGTFSFLIESVTDPFIV